uniref:Gamma-tubulin complex component n=1 Tax=Syphacia muris TaxID=451379 RepID=A0A0N5ATY4_9BILA
MNGDAIWEPITWLVSSLVGHRCTHRERIQCYEQLLAPKTLEQSEYDDMSADEIIQCLVRKFKSFGDDFNAEKISRLYLRIKRYHEYEAIIRCMVLLVDFNNLEQILKQKQRQFSVDNYELCVLRELDTPLVTNEQLKLPSTGKMFKTLITQLLLKTGIFMGLTVLVTCPELLNNNVPKSDSSTADERGNVKRYSICPQICSFHVSNDFQLFMVSWNEVENSLKHLLCGEVSSLFRRNENGLFYFWGESSCFLDSDDCFYKLFYTITPFLDIANSLIKAEKAFFAASQDLQNNRCSGVTKALCILLGSVDSRIALFRTKMWEYFMSRSYLTVTEVQDKIEEAFEMSREITILAKIAVQIWQRKIFLASHILDSLYFFRNSLSYIYSGLNDAITGIMANILEFMDEAITRWLRDGSVNEADGVFQLRQSRDTDVADVSMGWEEDFGICLPSCVLLSNEFCKRWVQAGKLQTVFKIWSKKDRKAMKTNVFKDNTITFDQINFNKLLQERTVFNCIEKCLDKKHNVVVHSAKYKFLRKSLSHLYRCIFSLIHDILLCLNGSLTDAVTSLLNDDENINNLKFVGFFKSRDNFVAENVLEYLKSCNILGENELHLLSRFSICCKEEKGSIRLIYRVVFPMQLVFTNAVMKTYSDFWEFFIRINRAYYLLLEIGIGNQLFDAQVRLIRSMMLNFISSVREYLLFQVSTIVALNGKAADEEFSVDDAIASQKSIVIEIRRRCFFGKSYKQLMRKLREIINLSLEFCSSSIYVDKTAVILLYKKFLENYDFVWQAVRELSFGSDNSMNVLSAFLERDLNFRVEFALS